MSPRLRLALSISFLLNAALTLAGRYRLSYDAYIHMFFADHYARSWWSLWEPRWYGGFAVVSYPPLVHQLIALGSRAIGVEAAFALLFMLVLGVFPLGVYVFARVFVGKSSAENAALGGAVVPAVYYSAHTFGQLPTLFSLLFALFCLGALARFLRGGDWRDCLLAVALAGVVAASHHATLLFIPPAVAAVALHQWLNGRSVPRPLFVRLIAFGVPASIVVLLVIWPFWQWGMAQTIQTPIEHPSRHNFIQDPLAAVSFFYPMYGPLLLVVPWALWRTAGKRLLAPGALFSLFFLLGLGDTTPLPRLLFGQGWAWLTYDRFALWAGVVLLVFFGQAMLLLERRLRQKHRWSKRVIGAGLSAAVIALLGAFCVFDAMIPSLLPTQPPHLDMQPVVSFLAANNSAGFYYLTFGFGDQLASLSRLTTSRTLDGSYHTARELPELRRSGLAQMDTAVWFPAGLEKLDHLLEQISARGVRWAFVYRRDYTQLLRFHDWRYLMTLADGVQVWEKLTASLLVPTDPAPEAPFEQFSWGVLPLFVLLSSGALALARWRPARAQAVFAGVYNCGIGLLPIALSLWYFRPLSQATDPRVYFTYGDAIFYLSDGLILLCVIAGGLENMVSRGGQPQSASVSWSGRWLTGLLISLAAWSTLSIAWSIDRRLSLAFAAQLWLLFGLFQSLRQRPLVLRFLALGCAAALSLQLVAGAGQLITQSTSLMSGLGLAWPGTLTVATSAASIVQLENGTRWLRLYGSMPHPNMLGGLLLLLLAGTAHLALGERRSRLPALVLFAAGVGLLVLTFSRSAWLGFAAGALLIVLRMRSFEPGKLLGLALSAALGALAAALPFHALVQTRLTGAASPELFNPEVTSVVTRYYLAIEAQRLIQNYPLLGSGAGTFVVALSRLLPSYFSVEPVHNLLLLAWAELGPIGLLLAVSAAIVSLIAVWRARSQAAILAGSLVLGLFVIGLLDHYLWTLPPTRAILWLALGMLVSEEEHA